MQTVVNDNVKIQLEQIFRRQAGSYLVVGPEASGKFTAILELAKTRTINPLNLIVVEPDGASLKIEQIHALIRQLRFKEAETGKRMVIIRDAQLLTREAQNAFLKTLEEPPTQTLIVLTATNRGGLLPTILSRCQVVEFGKLDPDDVREYLSKSLNADSATVDELLMLGDQAIGRAVELSQNEHLKAEQKLITKAVDELMDSDDTYARLKVVLNLEGQIDTASLLNNLINRLQRDLRQNMQTADTKMAAKLISKLKVCHQLNDYLLSHGNAKLALIYTALNL